MSSAAACVHGFLDDQGLWDRIPPGLLVEFGRLNLACRGERRDEQGPFDLEE